MPLNLIDVATDQVDKQRIGYISVSLSNYDNTNSPEITEGSVIELNGDLYRATANQSIAGWAGIGASTQTYIKIDNSGASSYTTTPPTWDTEKQGWYDGTDRYIAEVYKVDAATYSNKKMYINRVIGYNANINIYNTDSDIEVMLVESTGPIVYSDFFEILKPITGYLWSNDVVGGGSHDLRLHAFPYSGVYEYVVYVARYRPFFAVSFSNNPYNIQINPGLYRLSVNWGNGGVTTAQNKLFITGVYGTLINESIRIIK